MDVLKEIKPFDHQIKACDFALKTYADGFKANKEQCGCALLMEMGTGKTLTSIMIFGRLFAENKIHKVLIVAPLSILSVWKNEITKFANFKTIITVLTGTAKKKEQLFKTAQENYELHNDWLHVLIVNYETTWRMENEILNYNADIIIADEGHKIKEARTAQSKMMHKLGDKARYKLLLTGTPITNKELDIFSEYRFCDVSIFGKNFFIFRNNYFYLGFFNEPIFIKAKYPEFTEKLHSIAYRVTKSECLDLPDIIEEERLIELEDKTMKLYKQIEEECYAEFNNGEITATNILTKILRLSEITGGYIPVTHDDKQEIMNKVSDAKMDALKEIIKSCIEENQKVVIMMRFIKEIEEIEQWLNISKIKFSKIHGGVKDREQEINNFQTNDEYKVFIGQIQAAGMGITLTAAHIMVFYSLDYSMSNFDQAKARIHRPGQTNKCQYIYLIAKDTIDENVIKSLRKKVNLAEMLIDQIKNSN